MRTSRTVTGILGGLLLGAAIAAPTMLPCPARAQGAAAPPAAAPSPTEPALAAEVTAALQRMGKTLSGPHFSFRAKTIRAYAGPNGELLHIEHMFKSTLRRPDKLAVEASGDDGATKLFYDGKNLSIIGHDPKKYAAIPTSGSVGSMMDALSESLGLDFPLADLFVDKPAEALLADITSGGQVGTATIDGVACRHYYFTQLPDIDLELWLEDNEKALPRRVAIVYRTLPGRPNFIADLWDWDLTANPADTAFTFQPGADMTKIDLKPRAGATPAAAK